VYLSEHLHQRRRLAVALDSAVQPLLCECPRSCNTLQLINSTQPFETESYKLLCHSILLYFHPVDGWTILNIYKTICSTLL